MQFCNIDEVLGCKYIEVDLYICWEITSIFRSRLEGFETKLVVKFYPSECSGVKRNISWINIVPMKSLKTTSNGETLFSMLQK